MSATRQEQLQVEFDAFHAENPVVFQLFVQFTQQVIAAGLTAYSADAIIQRIRWHTSVETQGDEYLINDHFTAFYARLFHKLHPQHDGFFRTRKQRSQQVAIPDSAPPPPVVRKTFGLFNEEGVLA